MHSLGFDGFLRGNIAMKLERGAPEEEKCLNRRPSCMLCVGKTACEGCSFMVGH